MTFGSSPTAYKLRTNRTTYDTVFNCDAVQMIKFDYRMCHRTFATTSSSPKPSLELSRVK